jgi:frataxin
MFLTSIRHTRKVIQSRQWPVRRTFCVTNFPEPVFHNVSESTLEELAESLYELENSLDDFDVNVSQGVLTIKLGSCFDNKTWVINKQTPNRQLWWSSPISGPRRFEYTGNQLVFSKQSPISLSQLWKFSKDNSIDLWSELKLEIETVTGVALQPTKS